MKAGKRAKIELRMEELEKELERVKQESIEWQVRYSHMTDQCSMLEKEAANNAAYIAKDEYIVDLLRKLHQLKPCMAEYNPGLYRVFCLVDRYNDGYVAVAYLVDGNGKVVHQRVIGNTSGRTVENYHMTDLWERLHHTGALIDYNLAREDGMKFIDQVLAKEDTKESDDSISK